MLIAINISEIIKAVNAMIFDVLSEIRRENRRIKINGEAIIPYLTPAMLSLFIK